MAMLIKISIVCVWGGAQDYMLGSKGINNRCIIMEMKPMVRVTTQSQPLSE